MYAYNVFCFNLPFRKNIDYGTFANTKSQKGQNIPAQKNRVTHIYYNMGVIVNVNGAHIFWFHDNNCTINPVAVFGIRFLFYKVSLYGITYLYLL